MSKAEAIGEFLGQKTLALVGVSRGGKKFGNSVLKDLAGKGYRVFPVHPSAEMIGGVRCWPDLKSLPEPVGGVVVVVPPEQTDRVVRDAHEAGIRRVWMQPGAESPEAVRFCEEQGMRVVEGECILMFAEPVRSIHGLHRGLWRLLGRLPR